MCVGINFSKALCQSERPFARRQRLNLRRPHLNKVSLRFADRWNIGIPACAPSGFPRCSAPVLSHQRSKTPLRAQTWKSVFRREGQTIRRHVIASHDNCGSRQNNHHQPDQYNAEANRADEKSAQARPRFEPETRNPFLKPTIHKKGLPRLRYPPRSTVHYLAMKPVSFCSRCGGTCAVITA